MKLNAACDSKLNPIALKTIFGKINCEKFFEMGIPDHLTCLLRNLLAGQEATVSPKYGTMVPNWKKKNYQKEIRALKTSEMHLKRSL